MKNNSTYYLRFFSIWAILLLMLIQPLYAQNARDITSKYIRKIGRPWKLRKLKNVRMELEVNISGMQFRAEVYHKGENMYKQVLFFQGDTVQKQVFNQGEAFISNFDQSKNLPTNELEAFRHQAFLFPELAFDRDGYSLNYEGVDMLNNIKTHKIRVTTPRNYTFYLWYHKKNGLRIRSKYPVGAPGEDRYLIADIMKYQDVQGLHFPVYKRIMSSGNVIVMRLRSLKFPELEASLFHVPSGLSQN